MHLTIAVARMSLLLYFQPLHNSSILEYCCSLFLFLVLRIKDKATVWCINFHLTDKLICVSFGLRILHNDQKPSICIGRALMTKSRSSCKPVLISGMCQEAFHIVLSPVSSSSEIESVLWCYHCVQLSYRSSFPWWCTIIVCLWNAFWGDLFLIPVLLCY